MYGKRFSPVCRNELIMRLLRRSDAVAEINGEDRNIRGNVRFYQTECGVLVAAEIYGFDSVQKKCEERIPGFHIHEGNSCSGDHNDPFADAMSHYNPDKCLHPYHAGDMPPLFVSCNRAFMVFLTDRFTVDEIIGRTVIIHSNPDDFTTNPSGNSGPKIACGEIKALCPVR